MELELFNFQQTDKITLILCHTSLLNLLMCLEFHQDVVLLLVKTQ